jgi:hypothetical protein
VVSPSPSFCSLSQVLVLNIYTHDCLVQSKHLKGLSYGFYITDFFGNTYTLYIETPRPNTNRHVHAHKYLHCAGIEPATSCVVGEYSHQYTKSAVIDTYHSRFIPKGVAEASQIFHLDAHILPKRLNYE